MIETRKAKKQLVFISKLKWTMHCFWIVPVLPRIMILKVIAIPFLLVFHVVKYFCPIFFCFNLMMWSVLMGFLHTPTPALCFLVCLFFLLFGYFRPFAFSEISIVSLWGWVQCCCYIYFYFFLSTVDNSFLVQEILSS